MENSVGQKPNLHENIFTQMLTLLFAHLPLPHFLPSLLENRICNLTLVDLVILFLLYRHLFVSPLLFPPSFYRSVIQAETIGLESTILGPSGLGRSWWNWRRFLILFAAKFDQWHMWAVAKPGKRPDHTWERSSRSHAANTTM